MPSLQQDLIEAQTHARNLGLDIKKADDAVALSQAIPNNKLAAGASTPGNFQSMSRVRQAAGSIFGGSGMTGLLGIPRFMISKKSKPSDPAYLAATSQEHFSQTPESKANLEKQLSLRKAAKGNVDALAEETAKAQRSSSPAERAAELGDDWAKGYAQGIDRSASQAARASGEMVDQTFKVTDKRSSQATGMIGGGLPANPQTAQAMIDAQYGPQQPAKKGMGNKLAGFALRKMKIDEDSLAAGAENISKTKKQTEAIDGETKARRTSMEGFKTLNGRLMAGSFAVDSVAIGMSMMGGEVGEMGQKLLKMSSMVTMVSMVLPLLASPIGLLTVLIGGLVAGYMLQKASQEEAARVIKDAAQKQADAMTGSALAIAEFGKAVGMQSIVEKAQQRRLGSDQASIFFQALTGGEMESTLSSYRKARVAGGDTEKVIAGDIQSLAIQYDFSAKDVESYISAVSEALGDSKLKVGVRAELIEMLYSDDQVKKDLLSDPSIPIDVVGQFKTNAGANPGAFAMAVSGGINEEASRVQKNMRDQKELMDKAGQKAIELGFEDLRSLAIATQQAETYNKSSGFFNKFKAWAGMDSKANDIAATQTIAKGETSRLPGVASRAGTTQEDAKKEFKEISDLAKQYESYLTSTAMSTNLLFKEMDNQKTAMELLKQEYELGNMSLTDYRDLQEQINAKQRGLTDNFKLQAAAAKEAGSGAYKDFIDSSMSLIQIQVEASNATDGIKKMFSEFADEVEGTDAEANFALAYKNFDGSLEDFLLQWQTLQDTFDDQKLASEVSVFMSTNSIDLEYIDQMAIAIKSLPENVRTKLLVDGEVTPQAAAALNTAYLLSKYGASFVANTATGREGYGPVKVGDLSSLKDLPGINPVPGTGPDKDDEDKGGGGGGGKKKKDTWVQKRQKEWNKVQAKIKLEEAEIDASYTKNFSDNLNSNLRSAGLLNSNGQLIINLPGAALNLGNITSQESLDAVRKKIELNLLNLEEKKIPHEKKIKALNKEISANNRIQELNKRKIDQINKSYENQSKALEQVSKIQDYMNRQRQAQTSLAEALSGGDLAAAVKAAQAAQAEQSKFILDNQKDTLDAQREASTFAYEEQNRLIDELNQSLQDQIYNEERVLEGIQDQVDAYNEVTSAIDRAVKKMELLRDITKSAIVVQGPGGGLVTSSQAAANADIFGAADAVLGDKGTKANYYKSLDQAGYDQQILAGASAQLAALNAAKDAFNVSLKSDSLNALTQSIIDGLRQATFNVSGLSASAGASGITATSSSNVYNSTSAPVYNISINVSNSNASPQDIASAVNQTIRSYNY
jgi:hypothetical protein